MRLQQYITNEATITSGVHFARKVIEFGIDRFHRELEKRNFNVTLENLVDDILDKTFGKYPDASLIFLEAEGKKKGFGYYVFEGATAPDGSMGIYISQRTPKYLFTFKNKKESDFINNNRFLEELEDILAHEYTHVQQYMKRLGLPTPIGIEYKDYLADPDEIGAYAVTIAQQIERKNKSVMLWVYELHFGPNHKVLKKLKKKVVDVLQDMGYDDPGSMVKSNRPKGWKKVFKSFKKRGK